MLQATLVLADGQIVTANKDENTDLFWAIRGGGGNFGVVVEFVLQLHEQRRVVYAGPLIYPGNLVEDVFKVAKQKWESGLSENEGVILITTRGPPPERHVSHDRLRLLLCYSFDSLYSSLICIAPPAMCYCERLLQWLRERRPGSVQTFLRSQ